MDSFSICFQKKTRNRNQLKYWWFTKSNEDVLWISYSFGELKRTIVSAESETVTVVTPKSSVFWDVTLWSSSTFWSCLLFSVTASNKHEASCMPRQYVSPKSRLTSTRQYGATSKRIVHFTQSLFILPTDKVNRGSSVSIATNLRDERLELNPSKRRDAAALRHRIQTGSGACYSMGMNLTDHASPSSALVKKSWTSISTPPCLHSVQLYDSVLYVRCLCYRWVCNVTYVHLQHICL
jgi:hypothetical protein